MSVRVYYDGECPFCTRYVALLRLRRALGTVDLVDLREDATVRQDLEAEGFDLDEGMVVEMDGRRLGGADAANALALMSTKSDWFNWLNHAFLSSPLGARLIYPVLRSGRWLVLFLLGRQGLAAEPEGLTARRTIFATFFALFSIFHFFNYAIEYNRFPPQWDQGLLLIAALLLFARPASARALFLLMLVSTVSTFVQAPVASNHTMVRSALLLGYWASYIYAAFKGSRWSAIFANFTVAGQAALVGMYFFGIFHKINTDFLNPETSCAVALWRLMPTPLSALDHPLILQMTIYGTFVVEGVLILMLLVPRFRHYGIVGGILFHLLLAMSSFSMYLSFTLLSIALHALFLNGEGATRILQSREMMLVRSRAQNPAYWLAATVLILFMAYAAYGGHYTLATAAVLPIILPFCYLVVRYGRSDRRFFEPGKGRAAFVIGTFVGALFFANGFMPYLGVKSAQSINMFANLRLEEGISNHLILRNAPGPFTNLESVALIEDSGGDPRLEWYKQTGFGIVYLELLAHLHENPGTTISYEMKGERFSNVSAQTRAADIDALLPSPLIRKWFHFQPVDLRQPENCRF